MLRRCLSSLLTAALLFSAAPVFAVPTPTSPASATTAGADAPEAMPGHLIVKLKGRPTAEKLARVHKKAGTSASEVRALNAEQFVVRAPKGVGLGKLKRDLEESPDVEYAEPDYIRRPAAYTPPSYVAPNDPHYLENNTFVTSTGRYSYGKSWWLRSLGAPSMWAMSFTGPSVAGRYPLRAPAEDFRIGVIDTGVYLDHPDIGDNIISAWDFLEAVHTDGTTVTDGDVTPPPLTAPGNNVKTASHGTCTSAEIAATANNGVGTVGIGYDAQVMAYKTFGIWIEGDGTPKYPPGSAVMIDSAVISAIRRAADDGCKIISVSLGGYDYSRAEQDAITYARSKGAIVVAAAGNDGTTRNFYPAALPGVLGVGSYQQDGSERRIRSPFSNRGPQVDVLAPGAEIWNLTAPTRDLDGSGPIPAGYEWWDGTSMAAPAVAGSLSLLWRAVPTLTADEVVAVAQRSATDMGAVGRDDDTGYGAFNLASAYANLAATYPLLPRPVVAVGSTTTSDVPVTWLAPGGRGLTYDLSLDGAPLASGVTQTRHLLKGVTNGPHILTLAPRSPYNWADGSATATVNFTVNATSQSPAAQVRRLWGADRYTTNQAATIAGWSGGRSVVLVSGEVWPDALSAAPLATALGSPVVVTRGKTLSASARSEILRLKAANVVIVGGPASVSESVRTSVAAMGVRVWRLWGADRYTTAEAVARELAMMQGGALDEGTVAVASGEVFTDALVSSAVAAKRGWPILLARKGGAPASTVSAFTAVGGKRAMVVGRYATLSSTVDKQFPGVSRITAGTQLGVPVALANWATSTYPQSFDGASIALVSSSAWADGLSAGSFGSLDGTLVLMTPKTLASETSAYVSANKARIKRVSVVGGPVSVTDTTLNRVRTLLK